MDFIRVDSCDFFTENLAAAKRRERRKEENKIQRRIDFHDASLDDVQVIAYLYDSAGNAIGGKIITDSVAVSP